jgi:hypothetical protein
LDGCCKGLSSLPALAEEPDDAVDKFIFPGGIGGKPPTEPAPPDADDSDGDGFPVRFPRVKPFPIEAPNMDMGFLTPSPENRPDEAGILFFMSGLLSPKLLKFEEHCSGFSVDDANGLLLILVEVVGSVVGADLKLVFLLESKETLENDVEALEDDVVVGNSVGDVIPGELPNVDDVIFGFVVVAGTGLLLDDGIK